MYYLISDYSNGAHPDILKAICDNNLEHTDGYALDRFSDEARQMVRDMVGKPDAGVHLITGGTPTNIITITQSLKPYESVIAPRTGHIYMHECGGVEAAGHMIQPVDTPDGKIRPEDVDMIWATEFEDEHTVVPKLLYISNPTELGTIYTKAELTALRNKCDEHDMYLYIDGARLASALTSKENDLTIKEIADLADCFYLGGTKNGLLMGEAVVINRPEIDDHYRWTLKQHNGMLAKGRLLGIQFRALLEGGDESLFYKNAAHANRMADMLRDGIRNKGYSFRYETETNQMFPVFPKELAEKLHEDFMFYDWEEADESNMVVRFVTGWSTQEEEIDALLAAI